MVLGTQPTCIWFDGSYAAFGDLGGVGFDRLSSIAWFANIVMLAALAKMSMGGIPGLGIVLTAPGLALVEAWPRVDHPFGYPITLAHGPGYWLWVAADAVPLVLWSVDRCLIDRRIGAA